MELYSGIIITLSLIVFAYLLISKYLIKTNNENLMNDIPVISIENDRLEKHAEEIAEYYSSAKTSRYKKKLIRNLDENYQNILNAYRSIDSQSKEKKKIVPAAEWLLDNLYLIEKEYKDIKYNMPKKYYKSLPVLRNGVFKGYPRIYHIATEIVSHSDGRIDAHIIKKFIKSYQKRTVLTSGELWALPIMIRIALIQNISKLSGIMKAIQEQKVKSDFIAERIIEAFHDNTIDYELSKLSNEEIDFNPYFTERILKILRDNGIDNHNVYLWIDEKLKENGIDSEKIIALEHKREARLQVTMGNCINSLRAIEAINWRDYFEILSEVENVLRQDPNDTYKKMDFESRDYYRHSVEKIAKELRVPETFVAYKAIECAKNGKVDEDKKYERHVGYYLVDDGKRTLIKSIKIKETSLEQISNYIKNRKSTMYIGGIILGTIALIAVFITMSFLNDTNYKLWKYIIGTIALIIPCSEVVISIINYGITHLIQPSFVPKLELKNGIDEENRAIVVIPTLISSPKRVKELFEDLEVYYLANKEENLYFAILGDFCDSNKQKSESDDEIIEAALNIAKDLNNKYCEGEENRFFFLNRYRKYNEKEGYWLGWERKRGKLVEFNQLLRGNEDTSYDVISSDISDLKKAKYIITLDADTELPREAAKKLVGAMSHVLNKPHIDKNKKRVFRGYGLMQPRISVSIVSGNKTLFSRIFSGETGIDTYTCAVSDVYQDLFKEGIFTGKGIYDIDTFIYMLEDEIPENSVLSHDLLEGSYVRTALVTDVELVDGYPAYYNSSAKRLHRWVRGDWQLIPWISKNLNALSKWKIIDNLRRSLLSPSIVMLVILGLSGILPDGTDKWFIAAILSIIAPILFDVTEVVISPIKGISLSGKIKNGKMVIEQVFLIFAFIPYQGYLMTDAIVRTIYRLLISKKNFLQWQTAHDVEKSIGKNLFSFIKGMCSGSLLAILIFILSVNKGTSIAVAILPSCLIWIVSPYIAYLISKEIKTDDEILSQKDILMLRRLSRKTWAYFEDFVNDKNNWLGPDNFQEDPNNGLAHRTSPTNMGMALISNVSAHDFGYIGNIEMVTRMKNIINSMEELQGYKGHFYNWYDTRTKKPLFPRFVSTVDSGNLVGYLWVCEQCLKEVLTKPILNRKSKRGISDTLRLASEELEKSTGIKDLYCNIVESLDNNDFEITDFISQLDYIKNKIIDVEKINKGESSYWNYKLKYMIKEYEYEFTKLLQWMQLESDELEDWNNIHEELTKIYNDSPLNELANNIKGFIKNLNGEHHEYHQLKSLLENSIENIEELCFDIEQLILKLDDMGDRTDFSVLYDKSRELFSIGYDIENDKLNNSYYDLLASECRLASFIAIAKGDVEQKHWFKLGRSMTLMGKDKGLVSWSGTMFEYFMPLLVMKNYEGTILDKTYDAVINSQMDYGNQHNIPWGISESAFYSFDINLNYQYKAFGVPGIGLKRGLVNELVISPYSSILALLKNKKKAIENIKRLEHNNFEGRYGFYEAVDYTTDRIKKDSKKEIIKCFMIHHKGMSLLSLDNCVNNNILQERFHSIPKVKSTQLLLMEKVPKRIVYDRQEKYAYREFQSPRQKMIVRKYMANTMTPETHLLSNGRYSLMISNSGSGYSKKEDMYIYRWREDVTCDSSGMFFYIKDVTPEFEEMYGEKQNYWSATYEPCKTSGDRYEATFSLDKAQFERKDNEIITNTEIIVCSEVEGEIRKITITNKSEVTRILDITSYCEVILCGYDGDLVHPAFSNLFISTEYIDNPSCLIANRRPRAKGKKQPWMVHSAVVNGQSFESVQYETSRVNFIGRGNDLKNAEVIKNNCDLKNSSGAVLDPILSLRKRIKIKSGESCEIFFVTAVSDTREKAIDIAQKYNIIQNISKEFEFAWTQSQVEMQYLGIKSTQANLYQTMASRILFLTPLYKERQKYIINNKLNQSSLWGYGISGDLPIVIVIIREEKDIDLCRQILFAHEYWCLKGLKVDLVILNFQPTSYLEPLQNAVMDLIYSSHARDKLNVSGGVFVYNKSRINEEDIQLLKAIARMVIDSEKGLLVSQIKLNSYLSKKQELLETNEIKYTCKQSEISVPKLLYYNNYGGFSEEGDKYYIVLDEGKNTPAPWINVISNDKFGFYVTESGSSYTWYKNSREYKLTAWSNDYIRDIPSEVLYIRDDITGESWSITPKPTRDNGKYLIEHGFGYSTFKHEAHGIFGELTMFVPIDSSIKFYRVKLRNNCDVERRLSLFYYAQLVMGVVPQHTSQHIYTGINEEKQYIFAKNPYSMSFGNVCAALKMIGLQQNSFTGNRTEFIGRLGDIECPDALKRVDLSNTCGAGFDPCLASQGKILLKPEEEVEIIVMFGADESLERLEQQLDKYEAISSVDDELENTKEYWKNLFNHIHVKTPEKSFDILLNGWLMYQTLVCRIWARSAFYQSGGAYGFRDQLQDVMSLAYLKPEMTRQHILYSSSKQFLEGDVQHWWHPGVDSGIRTRFSDDLLWLPFVTIDYIKNTGDYSILNEQSTYLQDEPLKEGEDERYSVSPVSEERGSVYEHCNRAIDKALKFGSHNIPLMGSGDWNDGMSTIGNKGKGESVWLGWFLYSILNDYIEICRVMKDNKRAEEYIKMKDFIKENLEQNAWDGEWYRRAYFDDGTPLGSSQNEECYIDSLSQSWSIISNAADKDRSKKAMESLEKHLVDYKNNMILLLTPAFSNSSLEPGYIKGYIAGVRENGGQYTHASTWVILAMTRLGEGEKALKFFNMINPINHTITKEDCEVYKTEPYVMTADVYSNKQHIRRGGWSWYTGTAGWMYRVGIDGILGLKLMGSDGFKVEPCIPPEWNEFEIRYKKDKAVYNIKVKRDSDKKIVLDGKIIKNGIIPYQNEGEYEVIVNI